MSKNSELMEEVVPENRMEDISLLCLSYHDAVCKVN